MNNSEATELKKNDIIVPNPGRITSNGYDLRKVAYIRFTYIEWDVWSSKWKVYGMAYDHEGNATRIIDVFNDSVHLQIHDPDGYDIFTCK